MRRQELHPRTAVINKVQKNTSKKARTDALVWLAATFPAAFDNSIRIRPLKLGIMEDILQQADKATDVGISKSKLREAVVIFTRRLDYLTCLKSREMRVDLQGNEVSVVTDEEAEHAASKIKKRVEKSVRNARKLLAEKAGTYSGNATRQTTGVKSKNGFSNYEEEDDDNFPVYPLRSNHYSSQGAQTQTPKPAPSVVVKSKTAKQFDPSAVARLKEKLGLSRSLDDKKETVD